MLALAGRLEVDLLLLGERADQRHARLLGAEEAAGGRHAEALRHDAVAELGAAQAAEAAVAPRGAPADRAGLQHHGPDPVLPGQVVGGRQAGVAAADHRDIAFGVAAQRLDTGRLRAADHLPVAPDRRTAVVVPGMVEAALDRHIYLVPAAPGARQPSNLRVDRPCPCPRSRPPSTSSPSTARLPRSSARSARPARRRRRHGLLDRPRRPAGPRGGAGAGSPRGADAGGRVRADRRRRRRAGDALATAGPGGVRLARRPHPGRREGRAGTGRPGPGRGRGCIRPGWCWA